MVHEGWWSSFPINVKSGPDKWRALCITEQAAITRSSDRMHMVEVRAHWSWHSATKPATQPLFSMPDIETYGWLPAVFCNSYYSPQSWSEVSAKMSCVRAGWSDTPCNKQGQMDRRTELIKQETQLSLRNRVTHLCTMQWCGRPLKTRRLPICVTHRIWWL